MDFFVKTRYHSTVNVSNETTEKRRKKQERIEENLHSRVLFENIVCVWVCVNRIFILILLGENVVVFVLFLEEETHQIILQ